MRVLSPKTLRISQPSYIIRIPIRATANMRSIPQQREYCYSDRLSVTAYQKVEVTLTQEYDA